MKTIISGLKQWVSSQKSDWNQNDSSAANYVKNRTHYTDVGEVEVLSKTTYDDRTGITLKTPFVGGKTYTVLFNDVTYECVAKDYDDYIMIGNNAIYEYDNGDETDTGEPFAIESAVGDTYAYVCFSDDATSTPTLRITTTGEVVHKLDKKYLPDGLVSYSEAQELTDSQKLQARDNIGAGDFDGDYNKLINQPKSVLYTYQPLSAVQKAQARTNIGAGTSNFSGDYYDLTNRPTIGDFGIYVQAQEPTDASIGSIWIDTSVVSTIAAEEVSF